MFYTAPNNKTYIIQRPAMQFINKYCGVNLVGAEVGVYRGEHALEILLEVKPAKLYLIDGWNFIGDDNTLPCNSDDLEIAHKNLDFFKNKIEFIVQPSQLAVNNFPDSSLDFVYIDTEHNYESVKRDILLWLPKVKDYGVISGHDIRVDGVKKAVEEFTTFTPYWTEDWWFVKNNIVKPKFT